MEEDQEPEETFEEQKPKIPITVSMEPLKNKFFGKLYDEFKEDLKSGNYKFFIGDYKFASDQSGRPSFVVKNFTTGFIQQIDDLRKYLLVKLQCIEVMEKEYQFKSIWISNCKIPFNELVGDKYEDFDWTEIEMTDSEGFDKLCESMIEEDESNVVITSYLH